MATRWKKFSRSPVLKALAVLFTALAALAGLSMTILRVNQWDVYTSQPEYTDSTRYITQIESTLYDCATVVETGTVYGEVPYEYLVRVGKDAWTNSERDLSQAALAGSDWSYHYENGSLTASPVPTQKTLERWSVAVNWSEADEIILVMNADYMAQQVMEYERDFALAQWWERGFWVMLAVLVLLTVYLLAVAGRTGRDDELHLAFLDRWPTEILLVLLTVSALFLLMVLLITTDNLYNGRVVLYLCMAQDLLAGLLGLALLLSLARKAKAGRLWTDSFLRRICRGIAWLCQGETWRLTGQVESRPVKRIFWTGLLCLALCGILSIFLTSIFYTTAVFVTALLLCVVCVAGMLYLLAMQTKDGKELNSLIRQVDAAASGQETQPVLGEESPLHKTSLQIARLDAGVKESLASALKSERMKVELITNVSHDLKTPLTSIIGYLDLLEKQQLSAEAEDYVKILRKKSERLSNTVNDLFTLSKATSGEETVELEPLDLVMAVHQTLADMDDAVNKAGIPVRSTLPDSAWVFAENRRLYRVLQNILDNALRYSLAGSRIYLKVDARPDQVLLSLTNTAGYEMDFTEEEILQRFVRGDKARTTEGSGLGLSIAESFMNSFGGRLSVEVHGDAFTVILLFAAAPEQKEQESVDVSLRME